MDAALLVFSVIAAVGAVSAVAVPLVQQRERLELTFTGGYATGPYQVSLTARVENRGRSPIYNVELFAGPAGLTLGQRRLITTVTLQPNQAHDFSLEIGRPDGADIEPDRTTPTLKFPQLIIARRGRRLTITEMPAGPFSSDRAITSTKRRSWPF